MNECCGGFLRFEPVWETGDDRANLEGSQVEQGKVT